MSQGQRLKETLLPSLNLLIESSRIHRETRKFLRSKVKTSIIQFVSSILIPALAVCVFNVCVCVLQVLPPLRDVMNRPEVGDALRNKLVRLMTHVDTDVKDAAAEFLFVLCKENGQLWPRWCGPAGVAPLV